MIPAAENDAAEPTLGEVVVQRDAWIVEKARERSRRMIRTCRSGQMVEILADCHLDRELRGVPCDAARSPRRPAIRFFCEDCDPV